MNRRIAICYFSGTGNTAYVVEVAQDAFVSAGVGVDLFEIEDLRHKKRAEFNPAGYDMLGNWQELTVPSLGCIPRDGHKPLAKTI